MTQKTIYNNFYNNSFIKNIANANIIEEILNNSRIISFKKKEIVMSDEINNDYVCALFLLGSFGIIKSDIEENESILELFKTNDYFLNFNKNITDFKIQSFSSNCFVLFLDKKAYKEIIQKYPSVLNAIITSYESKYMKLIQHVEEISLKKIKNRLGLFLIHSYVNNISKKINPLNLFNKHIMAKYLNMTPESFSRMSKEIKKDGLIDKENINTESEFFCKYCNTNSYSNCKHTGEYEK